MEQKIKKLMNGEVISIYDKNLINAISKRIGGTNVLIVIQETNRFAVRIATVHEHIRLSRQRINNSGKELKEFLKIRIFWEEQTMKKKDLKNGMVVEYSIGLDDDKFAMVVNDRLISLNGFMKLKKYNEDLSCETNNDFDIIAVYEVDGYGNGLIDLLKGKGLKKLLQREEVKEMTLSQISKELGYDIKVVKEAK
jgi:hypothetical protein